MASRPPSAGVTPGDFHYQQVRRLNIGGITVEAVGLNGIDLDMDISVRAREKGVQWTVGIYNLTPRSWRRVQQKDLALIQLGWHDGGIQTVCLGRIESSHVERQNTGADTRYVIEGIDSTTEFYSNAKSKTWMDADIGRIARDLNSLAGPVAVGRVQSPGALSGTWTIKDDHPIRYWLDELVTEAEKRTETQWEWDARAGKFFFHEKGEPGTKATKLSPETGLHFARPATGSSTEDAEESDEVSFEAYLDPAIEKNTVLEILGAEVTGRYLVSEYEFVSDTVGGEHKVVGKAVPAGAAYGSQYPGDFGYSDRVNSILTQVRDAEFEGVDY